MTILLRQKPLTQVVRQIVQRDNGAWFDPEDLSTMFQDAAGTTPVTALEQPVGRWLDKSGNGNHAIQSITASRPTLSARYNLLTNTDNFDNAAWLKMMGGVGSTPSVTPNYGIAPDGSQTACRVIFNLNAGNLIGDFSRLTQIISIPANTTACSSIYVRTKDGSTKSIMLSLGGEAFSVISVTPEWRRISTSGFRVDTGYSPRFELRGTFGTSDSADILIWHPQLNIGTTPLPYQRVNTATDYDSVGWNRYVRFDGIDDYLSLPYIGLYANGAASIVAASDALSQTADTYVISERSTSNVNPKYFPSRQLANAGNMDSYIVNDAAAVVVDTVGSAYGGASDAVVMSAIDSGNNIKLFKNGALAANDNYTRSGTLTLTNTTIGASVSTTTSNYANMKLYGLCIAKSALSDLERRRVERLLAYNSGVQI